MAFLLFLSCLVSSEKTWQCCKRAEQFNKNLGAVTVGWGEGQQGAGTWACNEWKSECGGGCVAEERECPPPPTKTWQCCKRVEQSLLKSNQNLGEVTVWWGDGQQGAGTHACNDWKAECSGSCVAEESTCPVPTVSCGDGRSLQTFTMGDDVSAEVKCPGGGSGCCSACADYLEHQGVIQGGWKCQDFIFISMLHGCLKLDSSGAQCAQYKTWACCKGTQSSDYVGGVSVWWGKGEQGAGTHACNDWKAECKDNKCVARVDNKDEPAKTCQDPTLPGIDAVVDWTNAVSCFNIGGTGPMNCVYQLTTGLTKTTGFSNTESATKTLTNKYSLNIKLSVSSKMKVAGFGEVGVGLDESHGYEYTDSRAWTSAFTTNAGEAVSNTAQCSGSKTVNVNECITIRQLTANVPDFAAFRCIFSIIEVECPSAIKKPTAVNDRPSAQSLLTPATTTAPAITTTAVPPTTPTVAVTTTSKPVTTQPATSTPVTPTQNQRMTTLKPVTTPRPATTSPVTTTVESTVEPTDVPNCPEQQCLNPQIWNSDDCACKCPTQGSTCPANKRWNSDVCQCQCIMVTSCPTLKSWNAETCGCKCNTPRVCPTNKIWDESICDCVCKQKSSSCSTLQKWNPKTCSCPCKQAAQLCLTSKSWNTTTCGCTCKSPLTTCSSVQQLDADTCSCKCRNPTQCPAGKTWDTINCRCIVPATTKRPQTTKKPQTTQHP